MAAPPIPPIRLGLIGTGLAVEKLHRPALRGFADRYEVTAFTDSSAKQSRRFAHYSGVGSVAQNNVANAMVVQRALDSAQRAAELALHPVPGPVPLWRPRGSTGLFDGPPGQRISSSASFVA